MLEIIDRTGSLRRHTYVFPNRGCDNKQETEKDPEGLNLLVDILRDTLFKYKTYYRNFSQFSSAGAFNIVRSIVLPSFFINFVC